MHHSKSMSAMAEMGPRSDVDGNRRDVGFKSKSGPQLDIAAGQLGADFVAKVVGGSAEQ